MVVEKEKWSAIFKSIPWWKQEKVDEAKIMVVGVGALGNEVVKNLALLGVGNIVLIDYDSISYENLSRSILFRKDDIGLKKVSVVEKKVKEINPSIKTMTIDGDIMVNVGLGIFRRMDAIIGCLDNRLARLFLNRSCFKVSKSWIDGAIMDMSGCVSIYTPEKTCYECSLTSKDKALLEIHISCSDLIKNLEINRKMTTTPISASIIGAIQVQEALKIIFEEKEKNRMVEKDLYYEGFSTTIIQRYYARLKDDCESHYYFNEIISSTLSHKSTVKETLYWLEKCFNDTEIVINLDDSLVLEVVTKKSEKVFQVSLPRNRLKGKLIEEFQQVPNEELVITKSIQQIDNNFPFQELTLEACGIPSLHIITVLTNDGEKYVELTGDERFFNFS